MLCLFFVLSLVAGVLTSYSLSDSYAGDEFYQWTWESFSDPTHGRVDYVDQSTAIALNLTVASNASFLMRADNIHMVPPAERGRKSVRITSPKAYADSVLVLDLLHMPAGCATWPAWWTLSKAGPWPHGGEIDIIEGVNLANSNLASLHTTENCTMPMDKYQRGQTGDTASTNCDASFNYNQGCGVAFSEPNSYSTDFNDNGGGWYVLHRSAASGISIWFWSRGNPDVPDEVAQGLDTLNPDFWGIPGASFPTADSCDYMSHFDAHIMVFDLTFCGDWAGSVFGTSGCSTNMTCQQFVDNNPAAFNEAYWEILSLRAYQPM